MAQCVLCSALANVFCSQDQAFLCLGCDKAIHEANIISRSHKRLPVCALCKRSAACIYCKEDEAALCQGCEKEVHSANPLGSAHTTVPIEQALASGLLSASSPTPVAPCHKTHEADESSSAVGDNSSSGLGSLAVVPDAGAFPAEPTAAAGKDLKGLWGKDFDNVDLEAAWLGNFDMGLDLADFLAEESDAPGLVPSVPSAVPQQPAVRAPVQPHMLPSDDFLSGFAADEFPLVPSFLADMSDDQTPASGPKRLSDSSFDSQRPAQRVKTESMDSFVLAPPPPPYTAKYAEPPARKPVPEYKPVASTAAAANGANLTREQRVARWLEKRKNRKFTKIVRYASRKAYAEVRPRIKGRFATKQEVEEYNARKAAGIVGPEDHLMVFS